MSRYREPQLEVGEKFWSDEICGSNLHFHPFRYRNIQLQVGENTYLYLFETKNLQIMMFEHTYRYQYEMPYNI